jgi:hypothetical protein
MMATITDTTSPNFTRVVEDNNNISIGLFEAIPDFWLQDHPGPVEPPVTSQQVLVVDKDMTLPHVSWNEHYSSGNHLGAHYF